MDEHSVFFIDILGFSEAVHGWDEEEKAKLVGLVRNFASMRSDAPARAGTAAPLYKLAFLPAISNFSDHVVLSLPVGNLQDIDLGLISLQNRAAAIAAETAKLGLLIRGGATIGPLHHAGGVVVGQAMNEAHYLESQVSNYPRISVSRKLYSQVSSPVRKEFLPADDDGITHVDYFIEIVTLNADPSGSESSPKVLTQYSELQRSIARNIARFEEEEDWKKLAKWTWFKKRIEQARTRLPKALYRDPEI